MNIQNYALVIDVTLEDIPFTSDLLLLIHPDQDVLSKLSDKLVELFKEANLDYDKSLEPSEDIIGSRICVDPKHKVFSSIPLEDITYLIRLIESTGNTVETMGDNLLVRKHETVNRLELGIESPMSFITKVI